MTNEIIKLPVNDYPLKYWGKYLKIKRENTLKQMIENSEDITK